MASASLPRPYRARLVRFHRAKYGPELLVDVEFISSIPTFLLDEPHALDFYDITLITSGQGRLALDGASYDVRPGAVLFTTPGQVRVWDVKALDGVAVFFPGLFLAEFFSDPLFLERLPYFHAPDGAASLELSTSRANQLKRRLVAMQRELRHLRSDSVHLLRAGLYEVLITLSRSYAAARSDLPVCEPNAVTARFLALIEHEFSRRHSVAWYACELAVSPGYLNTLALRHTGRGAKELIASRLVLEARRRLLYTTDSAAQIADALGFKDPSYFARFFRARSGRSPSEFRTSPRFDAGGSSGSRRRHRLAAASGGPASARPR